MSRFIFSIDFLAPQSALSFILKTGVAKVGESRGKDCSLFFTYHFVSPDVKLGRLRLEEALISISLTA